MKILMLYYPRSGSTSILRYFEKLKPEYTIINQPWSPLVSQLESRLKISYSEIISHKDVLVKSTIPLFLSKDIPPETIQNDFDKIFILIRRNKEEQIESYITATKNKSFLDHTPTNYWIGEYNEDTVTKKIKSEIEASEEIANFIKNKLNVPLFYYEDLYYNNFDELFGYLGIEKNDVYFNEFLNISKKYKIKSLEQKNNKTLL
jgi:hypothetical protein